MPSLGNDLAAIRQQQDLSIEDIQKRTRIPVHILRSIEDDSIFDQIEEYTTYTRSYVRSYAKAIGIGEAAIVRALDQVEEGQYDGHLASGGAEAESPVTAEGADTEPTDGDPEEDADAKAATADQPDKAKADDARPADTPKPEKTTTTPPAASTPPKDWDWVRVGRRAKSAPSRSPVKTGLLLLLLLIVLIAGGYWIYSTYYADTAADPDTAESTGEMMQQPAVPSDSLQEALVGEQRQGEFTDTTIQTERGTLSDTLAIAIHAATGKLEPVRVYTDLLGKRNPYWVAEGDTLRFNFVNTVRIRAVNQYDRLQLLFNGHIIPDFYQQYYNEASGMVELDRSVFESHPEWYSAAGPSPSP